MSNIKNIGLTDEELKEAYNAECNSVQLGDSERFFSEHFTNDIMDSYNEYKDNL